MLHLVSAFYAICMLNTACSTWHVASCILHAQARSRDRADRRPHQRVAGADRGRAAAAPGGAARRRVSFASRIARRAPTLPYATASRGSNVNRIRRRARRQLARLALLQQGLPLAERHVVREIRRTEPGPWHFKVFQMSCVASTGRSWSSCVGRSSPAGCSSSTRPARSSASSSG